MDNNYLGGKKKSRSSTGRIRIKAYKKRSGVVVKAHYTKNRGAKGRTPAYKRVLPKLKSGEFRAYGYSTKLSSSKRLSILKKIVKDYSYSTVIKRLVVLRNYEKSDPKLYKKFNADVKGLQKWRKSLSGGKKKKKMMKRKHRGGRKNKPCM